MTDQHRARIAGALYLATFATSIPALLWKTPFLRDGSAPEAAAAASLLEVVLAFACAGTAVALFPLLRRRSETLALGFVAARTIEATLVLIGVAVVLAIVGGAERSLVPVHDAVFLLGPGLMPAINAALLAPAVIRARLVPRAIPVLGLVGSPLLMVSAVLSILGAVDQVSGLAGLLALPIALWEFVLGAWLLARGAGARPGAGASGEVSRRRRGSLLS
ncbi:DUF4386 domain-containing protein [Microbacterium sp. TNHR37B]|uniref:DUF4386 domain-containing protein n=1 Tax=Microbacterium sp. TNHR37B TaxID=1775956 RepID=UPI0007B19CED|nr:DUF4386 domain-containing protein [Microbacterium sp. TNHR37B]KZE91859.1 hypothetical protein AVP41_01408 [Microbacterium sp. TNHR37B]